MITLAIGIAVGVYFETEIKFVSKYIKAKVVKKT